MTTRPLASICITHYNNAPTIRESLDSILGQIDGRFEVVVVDNLSKDGSREILRDYATRGSIRLIEERCSRGRGRQIGFEASSGDYIISGVDLDDVFRPVLVRLLDAYRRFFDGKCLFMSGKREAITIVPRALAERVGGWRDVPAGEDLDFWARAAKEGELIHVAYRNIQSKVNPHEGVAHRTMRRLDRMRSAFIIGINPLRIESDAPTFPRKVARRLIVGVGYLAHLPHRKFKDNLEYKYRLATVHRTDSFEPPADTREAFVRLLDDAVPGQAPTTTAEGAET